MAENSFNVLVGVKWNSIYKNAVFSWNNFRFSVLKLKTRRKLPRVDSESSYQIDDFLTWVP